ncbi:hypothetical protein B566_EDAN007571 [Ephemera danica]|nr:hypothetical protein B566_EDAN007571 [Ephemera danica]
MGGSARTVMLATVSPARLYVEETLATLRYACQARAIVNRPHIQQASSSVTSNRQLQEELERLRAERKEYERRGAGQKLVALHAELAAVKQQLENERSTWETRVNASEMACARQTSELTKRGVAECSTMAGLRLLTPDPSLSLLFGLPGPTCPRKVLGSCQPPADIELQGPLVAEKHCVLEWRNGVVWLLLEDPSSECYVNGALVDQDVPLADGDRLALGGEFFLLVQLEPGCITAVDHEFARMELSLAQNAKLNRELTEAKERAIFQLEKMKEQMEQIGADKKAAEWELEMVRREQKQMVDALQAEVQEGRKRMEMAQANLDISVLPFTSNLLQELSEMEGFWDAGAGLGLHEMRCLVREATQRCHRLGLQYKFSQIQQAQEEFQPGKSALQPCIKVRKPDQQFSICSPYTFLTILNTLRDCENEGLEINNVYELMTELVWESEDEPQIAEASFEASVTVDVTPFRRHLLSLSLTVHGEEENESKDNIEKYLGVLHETMTKIQILGSSQQHLQPYLSNLKTAICQLERVVLHPHLESFQNSEPSTISHGSLPSIEDSYNNISDASSHDDSQPSIITLEKSDQQEQSTESQRVSTIDQALHKLKRSDVPSEPSIASSASTVLHSPPSISAQPTKSNMRTLSLPDGLGLPSKQVHFKLRKPSKC